MKKYKVSWEERIIVDSYISENLRSSHNKMLTLIKMYPIYKEDIEKYNIKIIWDWLIAFYKYNDQPETHFDYGIKTLKYGVKIGKVKLILKGLLYICYITPIRILIRRIKK